MNYSDMKTSYKVWAKPKLKKYKNLSVIDTINSVMSLLERIAMGRIKWNGVDGNGIALSRKIEEYLFYFRRCAIVDTKEVGLAVVRVIPIGLNIYGEPAGYDILTINGQSLTPITPRAKGFEGQIGEDNAIILNDSQLIGRGGIDGMWYWVEKIADAQISIDQQMINQRSPLFGVTKGKNQEQAARVEIIDVVSGLNAMVLEEGMEDIIKPFNFESQFNVSGMNNLQHEYLSRALSSLGVDSNQAFGKKERMIVDEAESNDEYLAMVLVDALNARSAPLINNPIAEKYNISCELAKPYRISTYQENHIEYNDVEQNPGATIVRETIGEG